MIVGTSQDEFDYAQEPHDATTRFSGGGGIGVSGLWDRLLFALRFGDLNLLISTQLSGQSRVLFHRQISDREKLIAPFLSYDPDPYLVIADGAQYWINDAYTTGDRYPYSERYGSGASGRTSKLDAADINYIRNSVKVVTNAYDGSITYYVVDDQDPVLRTTTGVRCRAALLPPSPCTSSSPSPAAARPRHRCRPARLRPLLRQLHHLRRRPRPRRPRLRPHLLRGPLPPGPC